MDQEELIRGRESRPSSCNHGARGKKNVGGQVKFINV